MHPLTKYVLLSSVGYGAISSLVLLDSSLRYPYTLLPVLAAGLHLIAIWVYGYIRYYATGGGIHRAGWFSPVALGAVAALLTGGGILLLGAFSIQPADEQFEFLVWPMFLGPILAHFEVYLRAT